MRKIVLVVSLLVICTAGFAQENYAYLSWNYQFPLSNREWLDAPSAHGGAAGYRAFLREGELSVGLDLNWITFDQYQAKQTFEFENGALTTDYFKYVYQYGAVVSGQYYKPVGDGERFFPYVGLGLGANYNRYARYYNIYEEEYRRWGFVARPEAGILYRFNPDRSLGAMAAVHYDYSTNKNDEFGYSNFSSAGFRIGIVIMSR